MFRHALVGVTLLALAGASTGCDSIRLTTVDTHETVLSRTREVVPGPSVRVQSRLEGARLLLQTMQGCDLVEEERVRVIEIRESDEDLIEEFILLGVGLIPLATGIALIVDAPEVYSDDRNTREYNSVGEDGAMVGGVILTSIGGLLTLIPTVQLLRVAAAGEEEESVTTRRGDTLETNVPCEEPTGPIRTTVEIRVGDKTVGTFSTDADGMLEVDLARTVPRSLADSHDTITVVVAGRAVAEIDMATIRDSQITLDSEREDNVWRRIDVERCRSAPPQDSQACAPLEAFLEMFPEGRHAEEARWVLEQRGGSVLATDPVDGATRDAVDAAQRAVQEKMRRACELECRKSCKGVPACLTTCVNDVCPRPPGPGTGGAKRIPIPAKKEGRP
ncbi:MAG: hypothetical protein JRI68_29550 [Deltaproteobacteria bacterium]|nr:hypothetical protein [Deltaproteobacteria bacterium]